MRQNFRLSLDLIRREAGKQYTGTLLGSAWVLLQPVALLSVYVFLFTVLRVPKNAPHGAIGQVIVIFSGLIPWWYFIRCIPSGLNTLLDHSSLITQMNFPVGVLPFVVVGAHLIEFVIGLGMLIVFVAAGGFIGFTMLMLIPATLILTVFLLGVVAMLAPIGVMVRDLRMLFPAFMRLIMFVTPILYLPSSVPRGLSVITYVNPLAYFVGMVRYATFGTSNVGVFGPAGDFAMSCGLAAVSVTLGYLSWVQVRRVAVDYL